MNKTLIGIALTILILTPLSASGKSEGLYAEVDALIADKEYVAALYHLLDMIPKDNDQFDNIQLRVRKILNARHSFDNVADILVEVMRTDPEAHERKLELITQLEGIEQNPPAKTKQFIANTKRVSQFVVYRARFLDLMRRGEAQIDAGSYAAAIDTFNEGFDMYQPEFFAAGYPASVTTPVRSVLTRVSGLRAEFVPVQTDLDAAVAAFIAAVNTGSPESARALLPRVQLAFSRYCTLRNRPLADGILLREHFASLQETDSDLDDASFLPFAYRLILGQERHANNGIIGATDSNIARSMDAMRAALNSEIEKTGTALNAAALSAVVFSAPADSRARLANINAFAGVAAEVQQLYRRINRDPRTGGGTYAGSYPQYSLALDEVRQLSRDIGLRVSDVGTTAVIAAGLHTPSGATNFRQGERSCCRWEISLRR